MIKNKKDTWSLSKLESNLFSYYDVYITNGQHDIRERLKLDLSSLGDNYIEIMNKLNLLFIDKPKQSYFSLIRVEDNITGIEFCSSSSFKSYAYFIEKVLKTKPDYFLKKWNTFNVNNIEQEIIKLFNGEKNNFILFDREFYARILKHFYDTTDCLYEVFKYTIVDIFLNPTILFELCLKQNPQHKYMMDDFEAYTALNNLGSILYNYLDKHDLSSIVSVEVFDELSYNYPEIIVHLPKSMQTFTMLSNSSETLVTLNTSLIDADLLSMYDVKTNQIIIS